MNMYELLRDRIMLVDKPLVKPCFLETVAMALGALGGRPEIPMIWIAMFFRGSKFGIFQMVCEVKVYDMLIVVFLNGA